MSQYTFLTGATGLVGSFLMRDLLTRHQPLAVLIRASDARIAAERIDQLLGWWEVAAETRLPRPVCLAGDVNLPQLGLSPADRRWVARHCPNVIHNAAVLKFVGQDRRQDPWRTNVEGTRRTLEFCREVRLREFHYVSTAYVCGRQAGVIPEEKLPTARDFRNDYEHSKHLAERLIRDCDHFDTVTIYRPVAISGDSRTGFTTNFHGIYVYLRLLDVMLSQTEPDATGRRPAPLRLAMHGDERRNVVPVDWVSRVICELIAAPQAHGRTFHLAPQSTINARVFFELAYRLFDCHGFEFCGPDWRFGADVSPLEQAFLTHGSLYREYERTDPEFDTANLRRFAGHLPCPAIDYELLRKYLWFGRATAWGKRPANGITALNAASKAA